MLQINNSKPAIAAVVVKKDVMVPRRYNLWYSLLFLAFGGLLIRLSFSAGTGAVFVLILGVILLIAAMVIFWLNFRE